MSNGYAAYNAAQTQTHDARDIEYRLLAQVTSAMMRARENPSEIKPKLEAVLWNRNVWSALRVDLSSDGNRLPRELRASLISVSIWIEKETQQVMAGGGDLDALIDINRNIMAGLKPETTAEARTGHSENTEQVEPATPDDGTQI